MKHSEEERDVEEVVGMMQLPAWVVLTAGVALLFVFLFLVFRSPGSRDEIAEVDDDENDEERGYRVEEILDHGPRHPLERAGCSPRVLPLAVQVQAKCQG